MCWICDMDEDQAEQYTEEEWQELEVERDMLHAGPDQAEQCGEEKGG